MKEKIIATDKKNLELIIENEINLYGNKCDLNHIDVSNVNDLSYLFYDSKFNGDISKWNVSKATNMRGLFFHSKFKGDISNWNVSNVNNMNHLFLGSKFNGDISKWRPLKLKYTEDMFENCSAPVPYWFGNNNEEVLNKIESYDLFNKMNGELNNKETKIKKMKI